MDAPGGWAWGSVSAGSDGEGVEVVGEDRPAGPGLHPVISLSRDRRSPQPRLVADPALDAGPVAGSALARSLAAGFVSAGDVDLVVGQFGECVSARAGMNPPSSTISRGRTPARSSSAVVWSSSLFSPGFPGSCPTGRFNPRAPLRVFSVISQIWATYPNSVGLPSLPLRIGLASGSAIDTSRVGDRQPADTPVDLLDHFLRATRQLF